MNIGILTTMMAGLALASAATAASPEEWPCWRGPNGSGAADYGATLVTDPKAVKLLWKSEEEDIPAGWLHPNGYNCTGIIGGYGGPVVSGGRVYLAYYVPSGDVVDEVSAAAAQDKRPEKWKVDADDVVLCLDANNGKTLWKTPIKSKGANHQYHGHAPLFQPVIAGGRVFLSGSGGWLYCLDAVTGKEVWTSRLGKATELVEQSKAAKRIVVPSKASSPVNKIWFNGNPAVAGGVVAANDYQGGLVGFDVADGKLVWTVTNCISEAASSPVVWTHKGKQYFVAAGLERAVAVEPKTGKELWEIKPWKTPCMEPMVPWHELDSGKPVDLAKYKNKLPKPQRINVMSTPAVGGDYLVLQPTSDSMGRGEWRGAKTNQVGMTCFQMSLTGAKLLWSHDVERGIASWGSPLIYGEYVYGNADGKGGGARVRLATGEVEAPVGGIGADLVSSVASDGRIIHGGGLFLAEGATFRSLGGMPINLMGFSMPFVADGRLYSRGGNGKDDKANPRCSVYCYDLREATKP